MKSRENGPRVVVRALALTTAISVLASAQVLPSTILDGDHDKVRVFTVDVAQDAARYAQNNVDPSQAPELFFPGDTSILEGTIYPAGTLPSGKADNDPNAPGGIGKYRSRATYTSDLANFLRAVEGDPTAAPILAFGTEMFSLPDDRTTILTDGNWPNAHFSAYRVVLGGTGQFRDVVGEVFQQNIGQNKTGFCNLRVTFRLK